jgi:ABC-type uncharacterized transport system permease subunit
MDTARYMSGATLKGSPRLQYDDVLRLSDHLVTIEKDLFSFLALFAALFSIKVFSGFFFSFFLLSLPLLMMVTPYG